MVLVSNILLILNPLIFRKAVTVMGSSENTHGLFQWAFLLIAIATLSSFFKYRMRIGFISISRDVEREVRLKLFTRIQQQSSVFYDRHGIGELLSRLTNDITAYRSVLGPGIMYPISYSTLLIPGMIALFTISKMLAFISLIPLLIIPLINAAVRKQIYYLAAQLQNSLGIMSNQVQENLSGIRIIKSYVIERPVFQKFRELCYSLVGMNIRLAVMDGLLFPIFSMLTKLVTVMLILFGGWAILKAYAELNAADFISFLWIQSYIFIPLLMLAWIVPIYERGRAAYNRLLEVYDEPIEVQDKASNQSLHIPPKADLAFHHLSFSYPTSPKPVLNDINLTIKGGTFLGITGPIGAGKSTLFHLINRDYEVPYGKISIGGRDIHDYPLQDFYESLVTVEQIPFLFSKTIAENVRFGKREASQEELEMVSKHADLHETVLGFPEQYDTIIGERGVTLSGGQKQRVAMARAFLVERSILLLDDIFSAVDTATEKRIFEAIKKNFRGKTLLVITHRTSILDQMDRIIYLQEGRIIEDGAPKALLQQNGYYAALVGLQNLERRS